MRSLLLLLAIFLTQLLHAQFHIGAFAGIANYYGDLNDKAFNRPKPVIGVTGNYELTDRIMLRGGVTFAKIEGSDFFSGSAAKMADRGLSFQSNIWEFSLIGELTTFNLYNIRWSPYIFGGVAIFHYNPYTFDALGNKVFLQPLSTEGQGLPAYPEKSAYALTDLSLPIGAGIKYNLSGRIRIGAELGLRKTFTDYLDDVSGTYPDETELRSAKGNLAVEMAYRGVGSFPVKGELRGNALKKDGYYFTGLHLTYRLGSGSNYGSSKKKLDCPKVVM